MIWEALAWSLALTLAIEGAVARLWGLRGRAMWLCVLVNTMTNPAVVLLHQFFPGWGATAALELAAAAAEGVCYARFGVRRAWGLAVTANGVSFGIGLLLNWLL